MTLKCCFLGFLLSVLLPGVVETQPANESLKPQRVHFQSRNFHNILHWQPGRACLGNNSIYFVQYKVFKRVEKKQRKVLLKRNASCKHECKLEHTTACSSFSRYGERQWKNKENCWGIREFFCDLTNETSDIWEPYYGRVKTTLAGIHSGWTMTQRFTPWWETKIDPPVMNITHINGSLLVNLHAPNLPYRDQKGENVSMEYYELVYRVFIINNSLEKEQKVYEGAHRVVEVKVTSPYTGYCVVAEIYQPMLDRKSQRSRERCVESP
ncbi:hypothetical protein K5549_008740 [Capra hircus]|nr:hypothetical protein K5549_008740 [Capra hircus]